MIDNSVLGTSCYDLSGSEGRGWEILSWPEEIGSSMTKRETSLSRRVWKRRERWLTWLNSFLWLVSWVVGLVLSRFEERTRQVLQNTYLAIRGILRIRKLAKELKNRPSCQNLSYHTPFESLGYGKDDIKQYAASAVWSNITSYDKTCMLLLLLVLTLRVVAVAIWREIMIKTELFCCCRYLERRCELW